MINIIGQHLMIGVSGKSLTDDEKNFIVQNNIGGVILFARNLESPDQIAKLCTEIQDLRHKMVDHAPLFIGVDMEGGRVARLKPPFTQWPPMQKLGTLSTPAAGFHLGYFMGQELKSVGINLNFAPCLDILTNPKNTVIGDRAFGTDAETVGLFSTGLIRGLIKADIIPCPKHFPGHGNTTIDSHLDLPIEDSDMQRLQSVELTPFKKAFKSRVEMVMTSHILFKKIDPEWPVTLSSHFLKTIIRENLRFQKGLIVTDDLDMKALTKKYDRAQIAVRALQAGANILLYCNEPESPKIAIEAITKALESGALMLQEVTATYKAIIRFKSSKLSHSEPFEKSRIAEIVGHPDHFKLSQAIAAGHVPLELLEPA